MSLNITAEHSGTDFVHKGGKLEKRQFLAKMHRLHQIASHISKFPRG